jgi:hypothetical protein
MLFYSQEQWDEYQDELAYGPSYGYNQELAALAAKEIEHEGEYEYEYEGPQERTATWERLGTHIYVRYPCGACVELPAEPRPSLPVTPLKEWDDEVPF